MKSAEVRFKDLRADFGKPRTTTGGIAPVSLTSFSIGWLRWQSYEAVFERSISGPAPEPSRAGWRCEDATSRGSIDRYP